MSLYILGHLGPGTLGLSLYCPIGWDIPGCPRMSRYIPGHLGPGTLGPYIASMGGTSQDVPGILGKLGCQTGYTSIVGITQGIPGDPSHDFHIPRQSVAVLDHPELCTAALCGGHCGTAKFQPSVGIELRSAYSAAVRSLFAAPLLWV